MARVSTSPPSQIMQSGLTEYRNAKDKVNPAKNRTFSLCKRIYRHGFFPGCNNLLFQFAYNGLYSLTLAKLQVPPATCLRSRHKEKAQHPPKSIAPCQNLKLYGLDFPALLAFAHLAFIASDLALLNAGEIYLLGFDSGLGVG